MGTTLSPNAWLLPSPTLLHDLHDLHHLIHVFPSSNQPLQHQHLVVVEHVAIQAAHHLGGEERAVCAKGLSVRTSSLGQTCQTPLLPQLLSSRKPPRTSNLTLTYCHFCSVCPHLGDGLPIPRQKEHSETPLLPDSRLQTLWSA